MKSPFNILIEPRLGGIVISLLLGFSLWAMGFLTCPESSFWTTQNTSLSDSLNQIIPAHSVLSHLAGFIFAVLIGLMLVQFNETFSFIRIRSLLPFFFFIILMGSNINMHEFNFAQLSAVFLLLALWQLFSIYQEKQPLLKTFNIGLFLAIGSFFTIELLFFIPIFIIGIQRLNGLTFRTFLASTIGFISPFILFLGIKFLLTGKFIFEEVLSNKLEFGINIHYNFISVLYLCTLTGCSIIAIINLVNHSFSDKIKVSRMLGFVSMSYIVSVVLFIFMTNKSSVMFTLGTVFSTILYAHYYSLHSRLFVRILFGIQMSICGLFFLSTIFFS